MRGFRKHFVGAFFVLAVAGVVAAIYFAVHSPLFTVQAVEVADQVETAPVDAHELSQLAAIPVGRVNLFDLDLKAIEQRILSNSWIREVRLQKRPPQTVSISVIYREPRALLQNEAGGVSYVDHQGRSFGRVSLNFPSDLPLLSGFGKTSEDQLRDAVLFVERWEKSPLRGIAELSAVNWDPERGFHAVFTYRIPPARVGRATLELGQEIDDQNPVQMERLSKVLHYLSSHEIAARQIWADAGKKIVVKTARGS